ncbi:MAG: aldolase/citrate lyase family protein [Desulfobacterales bacterium]|nr:aldolase/citrate lyase family protein [Desulfobacterales bacterium]
MASFRERVLGGEVLAGAWCNLGSSITVEMAALAGFDWLCIDQEHGPGETEQLLHQLQSIGSHPTAGIVRIAWNEIHLFKRALDLGAAGVMVPYVENGEEAQRAVTAMRYPPEGRRGIAGTPRAAGYGPGFENYRRRANRELATVVQVETGTALGNLEAIAAVEGVDVLFVGPLDLSANLGLASSFGNPVFDEAIRKVAQSARRRGKAAGILVPGPEGVDPVVDMGFTFIASGTDGGYVVKGMRENLDQLRRHQAGRKGEIDDGR